MRPPSPQQVRLELERQAAARRAAAKANPPQSVTQHLVAPPATGDSRVERDEEEPQRPYSQPTRRAFPAQATKPAAPATNWDFSDVDEPLAVESRVVRGED